MLVTPGSERVKHRRFLDADGDQEANATVLCSL